MNTDLLAYGTFTDYGIEGVAKAVVLQACVDYVSAIRKLRVLRFREPKKGESNKKHLARIRENYFYGEYSRQLSDCEWFFRSRWFGTLCELNAEEVIRHLRESAEGDA